jgi:1-pyrroline-5-carboxylate dehydrogenase
MSTHAPAAPAEKGSTATAPPPRESIVLNAAFAGVRRVPDPVNEPTRTYAPGSPERAELKARHASLAAEKIEIPLVIGGREIRTGHIEKAVMPHNHRHVLAEYHMAGPEHIEQAIAAAAAARREWASWPWEDRAAVLLRAAELLATTWRSTVNAATMLGQSKTVFQAEIDSACEMIDFWRFNAAFAQELYTEQPISSAGVWNAMEYRNLEGFVYAVTPFNFTAIGGNLTTAPALMGNTVIWKPASSAMLSAYYTFKVLEAAGMPPGVINFVPGEAVQITNALIDSPELAGIHFTGSTFVFNSMWKRVGANMGRYRTYPRLVGETGGKDFIVAHPSADPMEVAVAVARGGY